MKIEPYLIAYLDRYYPTYADVPVDKPSRFITVELTGAGLDNQARESSTVAIQCWAETRQEAMDMAYGAREAMEVISYEPEIYRCELNSMYNFPAEKDEPRYQLVFDLVYRA